MKIARAVPRSWTTQVLISAFVAERVARAHFPEDCILPDRPFEMHDPQLSTGGLRPLRRSRTTSGSAGPRAPERRIFGLGVESLQGSSRSGRRVCKQPMGPA